MMRALMFAWVQSFAELQTMITDHALKMRLNSTNEPRIVRDLAGYCVEFPTGNEATWAVALDGMYLFAARVTSAAVQESEAFQAYKSVRQIVTTVGGVS